MSSFNYQNSTITKYRAGTSSDPYIDITESKKVINGVIQLNEIPVSLNKVRITGYYELPTSNTNDLATNEYRVDYAEGLVYFNSAAEGLTLTAIYKGRGNHYVSSGRIWVEESNGNVIQTLKDIIVAGQEVIDELPTLNQTIDDAHEATADANTAAANADAKAALAATATTNANTATSNANTATGLANTATSQANTARDNANTAAGSANTAASNADTKASYAQTEGDYAKAQGDAAGVVIEAGNDFINNTKYIAPYSTTVTYVKNNIVSFNGSSYIAKRTTINNTPTDDPGDLNWGLVSRKGDDGTGTVHIHRDTFTATEGQRIFTLSYTYDQFQNRTSVDIGGVPQKTPENYEETNSNTITLSEGLSAGTIVDIKYFSQSIPLQSDIQTAVDNHTVVISDHAVRLNEHDTEFTSLNAQLAEKANKDDVNSLATNKAEKSYVDTELAKKATPTDITNAVTPKADKSELAVERARIDSFARLSAGSTTGDAELIDIRIGADGVVYTNAGDGVRQQFVQLNKSINVKNITFVSGYNVRTGTTIGATVSTAPVAVANWSYALLECDERSHFVITGYGTGITPLWAFLDKDNKLISYSQSTTGKNMYVSAPANAKKIIINSVTDQLSSGNNQYVDGTATFRDINFLNGVLSKDEFLTGVKNIEFKSGSNITLGTTIGITVDLTPKSAPAWSHAIIKCHAGTPFIISGYGEGTARVYGFLDANNKLIEYATSTTYRSTMIVAPESTAKVVINSVTDSLSYGKNIYSLSTSYTKAEALEYKNLQEEPLSEFVLSSYVNGLKFSKELQTPIADFAKPGDYFVHVPTHKIINGVVYMTYYANTISANEYPTEMTARFVYAPLNDLINKTYIDIQDIGDTFDGKTVTAIYDTILMAKDSETVYLMWAAQLDGEYCRLYRTFKISTGVLGEVQYNTFTLNANTQLFNVTNMKTMLDGAGIHYKYMNSDIGIMQKLSSRVENGITYYYTGCYNKDFNCIVKSSDLINWYYVATPDFETQADFENAVYVIGDTCYYLLRQTSAYHSGILTSYNLKSGVWKTPVYVQDCQSRSDFLVHNGSLYLVHAPYDRNHIGVMKINQNNLAKSYEIQTARVPFYFYPYMDSYSGELYMSFTGFYKHIWLSKFTIESITHDTISEKMETLFGI